MFGSAGFGTSLLLQACSNKPTTPTGRTEGFKIAIALPGLITDKAWNQSGYEGINLAKQKLNAQINSYGC